jgi:hypothetical protein
MYSFKNNINLTHSDLLNICHIFMWRYSSQMRRHGVDTPSKYEIYTKPSNVINVVLSSLVVSTIESYDESSYLFLVVLILKIVT